MQTYIAACLTDSDIQKMEGFLIGKYVFQRGQPVLQPKNSIFLVERSRKQLTFFILKTSAFDLEPIFHMDLPGNVIYIQPEQSVMCAFHCL